jgi:acyl transferase domain-containing protein
MIGHSFGEYVAACLAGVLSLDDALRIVLARGRLIEEAPAGAMIGVALPEAEAAALAGGDLDVAAVNGPDNCVLSGPVAAIEKLAGQLAERGAEHRRLHVNAPGHSRMLDGILERFGEIVRTVPLHAPRIPYVSNVTGRWITEQEATDPGYWVRHLRGAVRFSDGVDQLAEEPGTVLVEVGPGRTLTSLVSSRGQGVPVVSSMRTAHAEEGDTEVLIGALGRLWVAGTDVDWPGFWRGERRIRVGLPTYPFERRRYWLGDSGGEERSEGVEEPGGGRYGRPDVGVSYVAPRDELEQAVAGIWGELLGIDHVGVLDDFYALGGHSLLATRLVSRLRTAFEVELPLERILSAPTPARQAEAIRSLLLEKLSQMSDEEAKRLA